MRLPGTQKVLILSAILFLVSAIGTALPQTLVQFIVFRFVGGLGVGAASLTSPMYIAEIAPARMRGRMVSVNQFAIIFVMLVVYFVNYYIASGEETAWNVQTGWRWMFGSESLPALCLLLLLFLVPESPRWLVKQGREPEARRILCRLQGDQEAQQEIQENHATITHESASLAQFFQPGMRLLFDHRDCPGRVTANYGYQCVSLFWQ